MTLVNADFVQETTQTTGTGTYDLDGAVNGEYRTFVSQVGTGNTCNYTVRNGIDFETGIGTVTSGTPDTLSRDTIHSSSNGDAAVNWGSGQKNVYIAPTAKSLGLGSSPKFVGCKLEDSGSQSTVDGSYTNITYDTEIIDTNGFHSTTTNSDRITIPDGVSVVEVGGEVRFSSSAGTSRISQILHYDSSDVLQTIVSENSDDNAVVRFLHPQTILPVSSGDYMIFRTKPTGGTPNVTGGWFSMQVLEGSILDTVPLSVTTEQSALFETTLTAATSEIIIPLPTGYDRFKIIGSNLTAAVINAEVRVSFSDAVGGYTNTTEHTSRWTRKRSGDIVNTSEGEAVGGAYCTMSDDVIHTSNISDIVINVVPADGTRTTTLSADMVSTGTNLVGSYAWGQCESTVAPSHMKIVFNTGDIASGTFKMIPGDRATTEVNVYTSDAPLTTLLTPQATTSGTSIDFTNIPSGVKEVKVMFDGVSTNGTSAKLIQLNLEATGYTGTKGFLATSTQNAGAMSTGFQIESLSASHTLQGTLTLSLMDASTNKWNVNGMLDSTDAFFFVSGTTTLSAELNQVRLTTVNGTNTFDAGEINISYSY